jgi:hypothetical protein
MQRLLPQNRPPNTTFCFLQQSALPLPPTYVYGEGRKGPSQCSRLLHFVYPSFIQERKTSVSVHNAVRCRPCGPLPHFDGQAIHKLVLANYLNPRQWYNCQRITAMEWAGEEQLSDYWACSAILVSICAAQWATTLTGKGVGSSFLSV